LPLIFRELYHGGHLFLRYISYYKLFEFIQYSTEFLNVNDNKKLFPLFAKFMRISVLPPSTSLIITKKMYLSKGMDTFPDYIQQNANYPDFSWLCLK
jgi:hypothetical protein